MLPAIIGSAAAGIGTSVFNYLSQKETADYQKRLNAKVMAREDTAYQRAVRDAQQAGLSPLAVSGTSGASAAPLSASPAPQLSNSLASLPSSLVDAMTVRNQSSLTTAQVDKLNSETQGQNISNAYSEVSIISRLLKELQDLKTSKLDEAIKQQISDTLSEKIQAEIAQMNASANASNASARSSNATALAKERDNDFAFKLNVPPALFNTFDTKNPQSMFVFDALLAASQKRESAAKQAPIDIDSAYREYLSQWQERIDEFEADMQEAIHSGELKDLSSKSINAWAQEWSYRTGREVPSKKPLSKKAFMKRAGLK